MSCFKIDETSAYGKPMGDASARLRLAASVEVDPDRVVFAAATALAATHAGADFVLLKPRTTVIDPVRVTRDLLEAARQPVAVEFGCTGGPMARELIDAGAKKVVLANEALLRPSLVRELALEIGADSTMVVIDCHAAGPGCIEVLDSKGRPSGFDCSSWLEQLEVLGAAAVILRPRSNVPSEGLLHLIRDRSCSVYVERPGWGPELIHALGAKGVVVQGALGTRQHFDLVAAQTRCDIAG
jgi:hypothetical protein